MLGLLNLPQNWRQTLKQQKDYIKKIEKNKKREARSWLLSLDVLVVLDHRYHHIQKAEL